MQDGNAIQRFVAAVFDFSFGELITIKLARVLYIAGVIGLALFWLSWIPTAFSRGFFAGIGALIFVPIADSERRWTAIPDEGGRAFLQ